MVQASGSANRAFVVRARTAGVSAWFGNVLAKRNDEWEGTAYEGSSLRGAIKGLYQNGVCTDATAPDKPGIEDWALTYVMAKEARETRLGAYFRLQPDIRGHTPHD